MASIAALLNPLSYGEQMLDAIYASEKKHMRTKFTIEHSIKGPEHSKPAISWEEREKHAKTIEILATTFVCHVADRIGRSQLSFKLRMPAKGQTHPLHLIVCTHDTLKSKKCRQNFFIGKKDNKKALEECARYMYKLAIKAFEAQDTKEHAHEFNVLLTVLVPSPKTGQKTVATVTC